MKNRIFSLFFLMLALTMILQACASEDSTSADEEAGDEAKGEEAGDDDAITGEIPEYVTVAGATSGGTYFIMANTVSQLLNDHFPDMSASPESTPGSPVILELINDGDAEFGVAQAGVAGEAYNGTGQFEGNQLDNISQISYLYPNVMQFVVRKDAGIESITDLEGSSVAVGAAGSATEINSQELFEAAGFTYPDDINAEYTSESQSVELLRNGQADAANMIASLNSATVIDLLSTGDFEIIDIEPELIETLQEEVNPAYYEFEIPADVYGDQEGTIQTYAVANFLHARADLSDEFVYETLEMIYDNQDALKDAHSVAENIQLENATEGQTIPMHPGAIQFYEDNGVEVEE